MKPALATFPKVATDRPDVAADGVRVLARGLKLLQAFCPRNRPLSNSDLATATGLTRPTVSRITATLTRLGYLEYRPVNGRYLLGHAALALGFGVLSNLDIRVRARSHMQRFADENDLLVALAVREGMAMQCHEVCRGRGALSIRVGVGSRLALPHSAMGRAWIASRSGEEHEALLREVAMVFPAPGLTAALEDAAAQIRRDGFCVTVSALEPDVNSVATRVDLVGAGGHYVLGCSVPAFRYPPARCRDEIGPRLMGLRRLIEADRPAQLVGEAQ